MSDAPAVPYPQYCFRLAPTYSQWCLLRATTIHALEHHGQFQSQYRYFHRNLPVSWVRIVGVVVAVDDYPPRRIFTIDDGSGTCIECNATAIKENEKEKTKDNTSAFGANATTKTTTANAATTLGPRQKPTFHQPGCDDLDVGAIVDVKGEVDQFKGEKTILIDKVKMLRSTEQEVALWERRTAFQKDVLDRPWVLSEKQVRRCRREAEEGGEESRRERGREKKRQRQKEKEGGDHGNAEGLDGFGGPKDKKRRHGQERSHENVEEIEDVEELDGFGRPKNRKKLRDQKERRHKDVEQPIKFRKPETTMVREETKYENVEELDGFGRPRNKRELKKGRDHEGVEELDGFGRPKKKVVSRERGCEDVGELDGFGRPKNKKMAQKDTRREDTEELDGFGRPRNRNVVRRGRKIQHAEELDGFGKPKKKKQANGSLRG